jgi:hypothetical protein
MKPTPLASWFKWLYATAGFGVLAAGATSVIPPAFDKLVNQADYIVHTTVKSVTAEWSVDGANKHIITKVELDVIEVVTGTPPQPLVLVMLGGKIGDQELRVEGAPQFKVGEEDILFVHGNGQQFTPLVAMDYGRYRVKHDGATGSTYIARGSGVPLYGEQEIVLPMSATSPVKTSQPSAVPLTPQEFKDRIRISHQKNLSHGP